MNARVAFDYQGRFEANASMYTELTETTSSIDVTQTLSSQLRQTQRLLAAIILILFFLALAPLLSALIPHFPKFENSYSAMSWVYFLRQDMIFVFFFVAALLARPYSTHHESQCLEYLSSRRAAYIIAGIALCACLIGRYVVYADYDLNRDEQMADFDTYIYMHGHLFWTLPDYWRRFAPALNQTFIHHSKNYTDWASGYLPINAAIRALFGLILTPAITSPLFVAAGAIALWNIVSRLWPDTPSLRSLALILYVGSSQILITGMTSYAMSGHLALNLIWLELFLRDRRLTHLGAIVTGFFATGLHQLSAFHPVFVFPFLVMLALQRRYKLFAVYVGSYAIICSFWYLWPIWLDSQMNAGVHPYIRQSLQHMGTFARVAHWLRFDSIWLMALNLLRFVTWQHLLVLPLAAIGLRITWKENALARAIAASLLLPIAIRVLLLPFQGHGWGYRYLHGMIGSEILLACYGWHALSTKGYSLFRPLVLSSVATLFLVVPIRALMAHDMVLKFASASHKMDMSGAKFAVIQDDTQVYAQDLVYNRPDLSNEPIRFLASKLDANGIASLCSRGSMVFIDGRHLSDIHRYFGDRVASPSEHMTLLEMSARQFGCHIVRRN